MKKWQKIESATNASIARNTPAATGVGTAITSEVSSKVTTIAGIFNLNSIGKEILSERTSHEKEHFSDADCCCSPRPVNASVKCAVGKSGCVIAVRL